MDIATAAFSAVDMYVPCQHCEYSRFLLIDDDPVLIISNIPARGGRAQNVSQEEK
jgi:hypothetical protein